MRVLHVVESLDNQAVENWLVRMLSHARKQHIDVDWTFYSVLSKPGALDDEVRDLGAQVVLSPVPIRRKVEFLRALRNELRRGKYDVLHCHHDLVSAVYLTASLGLGFYRRIVHVHNADENVLTPDPLKQRLYRGSMRRICLATAERIIGISGHTLDRFLAGRPKRIARDIVHYYGVDPTPFENVTVDRGAFRHRLQIDDNALILLFAGRLVPEKNPVFVLEVLEQLRRREPRAVGVFAGAGSLEPQVVERACELGLTDSIRILGWRKDLPQIMACSDWFILPRPEHPMEGFGLAVVDAQLAGLRMLLSKGIPDDPLLPTASFRRLCLSAGPVEWAKAALELLNSPPPSRLKALDALTNSPMNMDRALNGLLQLYK